MSARDKLSTHMQRVVAYLALPFTFIWGWVWLHIFRQYKITNLKAIRNEFHQLRKSNTAPLIICPNHINFTDSIILIYLFSSFKGYLSNFYSLVWNFPKKNNVQSNWVYSFLCYIGKCILIDSKSSEHSGDKIINKMLYLLNNGEYLMVFPEGTRSQTGRVDTQNYSYGIGKVLQRIPAAKVLCVYLHADNQKEKGLHPPKKATLYCKLKCIDLHRNGEEKRLHAIRNLSSQVIQNLVSMEEEYFANAYRVQDQ